MRTLYVDGNGVGLDLRCNEQENIGGLTKHHGKIHSTQTFLRIKRSLLLSVYANFFWVVLSVRIWRAFWRGRAAGRRGLCRFSGVKLRLRPLAGCFRRIGCARCRCGGSSARRWFVAIELQIAR